MLKLLLSIAWRHPGNHEKLLSRTDIIFFSTSIAIASYCIRVGPRLSDSRILVDISGFSKTSPFPSRAVTFIKCLAICILAHIKSNIHLCIPLSASNLIKTLLLFSPRSRLVVLSDGYADFLPKHIQLAAKLGFPASSAVFNTCLEAPHLFRLLQAKSLIDLLVTGSSGLFVDNEVRSISESTHVVYLSLKNGSSHSDLYSSMVIELISRLLGNASVVIFFSAHRSSFKSSVNTAIHQYRTFASRHNIHMQQAEWHSLRDPRFYLKKLLVISPCSTLFSDLTLSCRFASYDWAILDDPKLSLGYRPSILYRPEYASALRTQANITSSYLSKPVNCL